MALHIRDERTVALVRELASRKGVSLTEPVCQAVENEVARYRVLNDDNNASVAWTALEP